MAERIDIPLLRRLRKSTPPDTEREIADSELTGLLLKHLPSGSIRFYCQVGRAKRETIAHHQGSGGRGIKRDGGVLYAVDAVDVLDRNKPDIALTWIRKEVLRLQGKTLDGVDYGAERAAQKRVPTLAAFLDETKEESYGWWVVNSRKDGAASLARIKSNFLGPFGKTPLDEITHQRLDTWRIKRLKGIGMRQATRETCNRDTGALRSALAKAVAWKLLTVHPLDGFEPATVDRHRRSIRRLYDNEIGALMEVLEAREERLREERRSGNAWRQKRDYDLLPSLDGRYADALLPAVELSLATGMRKGETFALTWRMVDLKNRVIRLPGEKTKSFLSREIPLNSGTLALLGKWKAQGRSRGYVFGTSDGHLTTLRKSFNQALAAAGITATAEGKVTWHSLRHTFGSRLGDAGVPAGTIKELLGHASLETTERYVKASEKSKLAAVEALG
jgi:integrase